jgi:hypothetical protein
MKSTLSQPGGWTKGVKRVLVTASEAFTGRYFLAAPKAAARQIPGLVSFPTTPISSAYVTCLKRWWSQLTPSPPSTIILQEACALTTVRGDRCRG